MARSSFLERHHFLFRRLHSLSGIVPIGAFLLVHLTTNSSVVWGTVNQVHGDVHGGAATFQHEVNFIHSLPFLLLIEIFILWLPIAFHAGFGAYYAISGRPNTKHYRYPGNFRYTLQRLTAWVGLVFIVYHVGTLRWGFTRLIPGPAHWEADFAGSTLAAALQGSTDGMTLWGWVIVLFYLVGVSSLVFHLANGVWTAAITWGVTITETAQKRFGYLCFALGAVLMAAGWASIIGFAGLDYHEARSAEIVVNGGVLVEPGDDMVGGPTEAAPGVAPGSGEVSDATLTLESDDERDG